MGGGTLWGNGLVSPAAWCREVRGPPQAAGSQGQGSRPSREHSRDGQQPGKADPQEGDADSPVTARGGVLSPLGRSVVTALEAELDQVHPQHGGLPSESRLWDLLLGRRYSSTVAPLLVQYQQALAGRAITRQDGTRSCSAEQAPAACWGGQGCVPAHVLARHAVT